MRGIRRDPRPGLRALTGETGPLSVIFSSLAMNENSPDQAPVPTPDSAPREASEPRSAPAQQEARESRPPRGRRGPWRIVRGALLGLGVTLLSLLTAVLCLVIFPPSELLRRAALPMAQEALSHRNIHIGALDLRPLDHLEIRDIWLGPPKGYGLPLVTIERILVKYDLSQILRGKLRVQEVLIKRPVLRVEQREGKLNWLAFLEGLPPSEPKPEEPPGDPPDIQVRIDKVKVEGLAANVDDGTNYLVLDGLHLGLSGDYSPEKSHFDLLLQLKGAGGEHARLDLLQREPQKVGGRFKLGVNLSVSLDQVFDPRIKAGLKVDLLSNKIVAPWAIDPIKLALRLGARANMPGQEAHLEQFTLAFNEVPLVSLKASLKGLTTKKQIVDLLLTKLHLPLDTLAPYAKALVKGVDFGGDVKVRGLKVAGPLDQLQQKQLPPVLEGLVILDKVWAKVSQPGLRARFKDLSLKLALAARQPRQVVAAAPREMMAALPPLTRDPSPEALSGTKELVPPLWVQGWVHLGSAQAQGATVRDLDLRLAAGVSLQGITLKTFGSRLALDMPFAGFRHPKLGPLKLSLKTRLLAGGDMTTRTVLLPELSLSVDKLLEVTLKAQAEDFGQRSFSSELTLKPVDLRALLKKIPGPLRAAVAGLKLSGRMGLKLKAKGRVPGPGTPPLKIPVELDARVGLTAVNFEYPKLQLKIKNARGELTLKGTPSDLHITSGVHVAKVAKADQRIIVDNIEESIRVHLTPSGIKSAISFNIRQVRLGNLGLRINDLHLSNDTTTIMPLARLIAGKGVALGKTENTIGLAWSRLHAAMPGNTLTLGRHKTAVTMGYVPGTASPITLGLDTSVASLKHAQQGAMLKGLRLGLTAKIAGPVIDLPQIKKEKLKLQVAHLGVDVGLDSVQVKGALDRALKKNTVRLELQVKGDPLMLSPLSGNADLELKKLRVRLPSRGILLDMSGEVQRVLTAGLGPLPPFDLKLKAGLDTPVTRNSRKATFLAPGLKGAGKVGLEVRVRRVAPKKVQVDGRLLAKTFNLWQRGVALEKQEDASMLRKVRVLHVKDMNAHVPFTQQIKVSLPHVSIPKPRRSIFDDQAASVLYRSLQPYTGGRSRLTIGGIIIDERITAMSPEGHFINTVKRRTAVDKVSLDLRFADSSLRLSRMYIKLFGGDIAGEVQAQLLRLKPLDIRLLLRTQVTGVNLAHLNPEAKKITDKTAVSAMVDTKYELCRRYVKGKVNITRLSLEMLDSLLAYLDPNKTNKSVQDNRAMINAWYTKWINPKVHLVSVWINHGNLNMDIDMDAWAVVGTILKRTLKNMRIRRVSIRDSLPRCAPEGKP